MALLLSAALLWVVYQHAYQYSSNTESITVDVAQHASWRDVLHHFSSHRIYTGRIWLMAYVVLTGQWYGLKPGEYTIPAHYRCASLIQDMYRGMQKTYAVTIVPGSNWSQLQTTLSKIPQLVACDTTAWMTPSIEGYFSPNTYFFHKHASWCTVLRRAREASLQQLAHVYAQRDPELDITPQQLLVIASIIERESSVDSDRVKVARVIYNRLAQHMPLQIDATMVHIAISTHIPFTAQILKSKHPYNTYTMQGLPPGPIAYPSLASLQAAAHPAPGTWLFYRLQCGSMHAFTDTFAQHKKVQACHS